MDLPGGPFKTILADPPWRYQMWNAKDHTRWRGSQHHYDCSTPQHIARLPVGDVADKSCTLLLWVTQPHLENAFRVMWAWGFTYKTIGFVWLKTRKGLVGDFWIEDLIDNSFPMGQGHWTRPNCELCLIATKGRPKRLDKGVRQVISAPRREHSRKPDDIYPRVERLLEGPYLELFSRSDRKGWKAWGDEIGKFGEVK